MTGNKYEDNMTEHEVMPHLPTSGQILGALVGKLGIRPETLRDRTARRYYAADLKHLVKDSTREEIIGNIAEVLTDSGFVAPQEVREDNYALAPTLASMLQWHADNWDLVRSFMRRRTMPVLSSNLSEVWQAYVRLASIDLALRVAAHLHIAGASPEALNFLGYANRMGRGDYLNHKRQQAGLTLEDLAEEVGVDNHTVDGWMYDGTRPSNDNLTKTATVLAGRIEGSTSPNVALELHALYWVSDIADLLAEHMDSDAVEEAIGRLQKYALATYHLIDEFVPPARRAKDLIVLADLGTGARVANPLLAALIEQETDGEWQKDLVPFGLDWVFRILSANLNARLAGEDDLTKKPIGPSLDEADADNPEAYAHYRLSLELKMQGNPPEAAAELEKAIQLDPLNAMYHYALGSMKTGAAMWTGRTTLVDEGLDELRVAAALNPNWILPWTEIGSTLHHTGRSAEAVTHLRNVTPECGPLDSEYHSTLGAAYWKVGKLAEALSAFEASLKLDPEETSTLLAASELALLLGVKEKHRKYLRRAKHFGVEEDSLKVWELLREFGQED